MRAVIAAPDLLENLSAPDEGNLGVAQLLALSTAGQYEAEEPERHRGPPGRPE